MVFEGKTYDIVNRLEWIKVSMEFVMASDDGDELKEYLKTVMG